MGETQESVCTYEDYKSGQMSMLPNCPQSTKGCLMHRGRLCAPIQRCNESHLNDQAKRPMFMGTETFTYPKQRKKGLDRNGSTVYNFYKLPNGHECFSEGR